MYEVLEHWKQYKQEQEKAVKLNIKAKQEMDKFLNQLIKKNGTTKY